MSKKIFVTGIGTGVGKTIVSAILTEALQADYWKPIQSGDLDISDSKIIKSLMNENSTIHPEQYRLKLAASPHKSAKKENVQINLNEFTLPLTQNNLIVEGAGGLFVPINEEDCMIDLIDLLKIPVVVVAHDYLGCINHSLLTIKTLINKGIKIEYFVFNGDFDEDSKRFISNYLPKEIHQLIIPTFSKIDKENISKAARLIQAKINIKK